MAEKKPTTRAELQASWEKQASDLLAGRRIVRVRYLTPEEQEQMGWSCGSIVLVLDNGTAVYPSTDDEGNGPGALYTNDRKLPIIPVF